MNTRIGVAALLLCTLACSGLVMQASASLSNPVTDWLKQAQRTVADISIPNQISARYYALVSLAQHKSLLVLKQKGVSNADLQVAVQAFAAHAVLSTYFPWRQNQYDALLVNHTKGLSDKQLDFSEAVGVSIANKLIINRVGDGSSRWARFKAPSSNNTGAYKFTPGQTFALYPQLAKVEPLALRRSTVYKLAAETAGKAHKVPSDSYYKEYDLVVQQGLLSSAERSTYNNQSAFFWRDGTGTSAVGGHFLNIAYLVLPSSLSVYDTADTFARITTGFYDASIACWKVKYDVLFWRPVTAIRAGDEQRKPISDWTPLLATPPHPEYPSGHQCTVAAALPVLQKAVGDKITFSIGSEDLANVTRTYQSLRAAVDEVGDSRVYAGVHFPKSSVEGTELGIKVGQLIVSADSLAYAG